MLLMAATMMAPVNSACAGEGPQPDGGYRRLILGIGLGRVEELAGLGDQATL
jgi:hypothetical protein